MLRGSLLVETSMVLTDEGFEGLPQP